jgi:hypothetical protein
MCAAEGAAEALKEVHNSVRGERCRETGLWLALVSVDVTGERAGRIFSGAAAVLNPPPRSWLSRLVGVSPLVARPINRDL